ncbi:MAG: TonB-dependent receptor, partial [Deltaproteobacteria bacterium]|nr:TonB-dependent receptor [Deltaproteobacteria bacterium]
LGPKFKSSEITNYNIIFSDNIKINDQWGFLGGLNFTTYKGKSWNANGRKTGDYKHNEITPSIAITFKPQPWITTYASYIESVDNVAPVGTSYKNAGDLLEPTISKQYEVGAKAELGEMFLTMALYQIDRAATYSTADSFLVQDGQTRHTGLELAAQGRVFDALNIYGGMTFSRTKIRKARLNVGKELPDAPKFTAKLYLEYDLPFLDGFTLTGSVNHYGKVFTNPSNNLSIPSHTIVDLGFRYAVELFGYDMAFRFNVQNIANKAYWYGGTGSHLVIGQPRSYSFIGEFNF